MNHQHVEVEGKGEFSQNCQNRDWFLVVVTVARVSPIQSFDLTTRQMYIFLHNLVSKWPPWHISDTCNVQSTQGGKQ